MTKIQTYYSALSALVKFYVTPLEDASKQTEKEILNMREISVVFSNIKVSCPHLVTCKKSKLNSTTSKIELQTFSFLLLI